MSYGQRGPATAPAEHRPGVLRLFLESIGVVPTIRFDDVRARDRRQPWGKGSGRASYAVVQRRRAANRRARASRRINRGTR